MIHNRIRLWFVLTRILAALALVYALWRCEFEEAQCLLIVPALAIVSLVLLATAVGNAIWNFAARRRRRALSELIAAGILPIVVLIGTMLPVYIRFEASKPRYLAEIAELKKDTAAPMSKTWLINADPDGLDTILGYEETSSIPDHGGCVVGLGDHFYVQDYRC